jgi:tRNA pseudouridine38-40 synthase
MSMQRFKLTIEYHGGLFSGWQRQENAPSVQQAIEESILKFCRLEDVRLHVAGRTDAGVHARGQVAHVDLPARFAPYTIKQATNYHLQGAPITILKVETVPFAFHARFSAIRRSYLYRIINRYDPLAIERGLAWHVRPPLDISLMQEGAEFLLGKHDFSTFRASECQALSPIRTVEKIEISRQEELIEIKVKAPSFLHHQVRNMVGTLKLVGEKKWDPIRVKQALEMQDRRQGGPTASAEGLYFIQVDYGVETA